MKRIRFYTWLILIGSAAIVACQKEKILVLGDHHEKTGQTGSLYHIWCASLQEGTVTLEVFHGGKEAHEFSYSWDGKFTIPYPDSCSTCRQIEIRVLSKGTNQNPDTLYNRQVVSFKLSELNLNAADLTKGITLKIMNTSDENNTVYLYSANENSRSGECTITIDGGDGDGEIITVDPDLIYAMPVVVVETSCDSGAWKNLWLKTDLSVQDTTKPWFTYLMPVNLSDSLYGYKPKVGDRLTGSFKKVVSDEVCNDRIADTQPVSVITLYKR